MIVNKKIIKDMELKYRRRFRALAKYHYNAGHDIEEHHERLDVENLHMKDRYKLPDTPEKPFYPGIDKLNLPSYLTETHRFKERKELGHFGILYETPSK